MAMFFNKGKPNLKSERYYEDYEPQGFQLSRYVKFSAFVVVALVLVAAVIISMVAFNLKNNTLVMFNKASSKNFDCGSFSYQLNAKLNDELYMMYDGAIEFDLHDRKIESVYHAVYKDYEYDAVTYAQDSKAIRGNYYNGKWTTEDYSDRALDFFGFYNDYRRGKLDAGAAVRFTQTNDKFAARPLKTSIESIIKELSKPTNMNAVMHQKMVVADGDTTITFNPEIDKVFDIMQKLASYVEPTTVANATGDNFLKNQQLILDNKALFMPNGTWVVGEMADAPRAEGFRWGFSALPAIDGERYSFTFFEQGWIPSEADNKEEAKKFLAFLYSDEATRIFARSGAVQPIKNSSDFVKGENALFYSVYDSGAKAIMGGFRATEALEGVSIGDTLFNSINSVVSGDKSIKEWKEDIKAVCERLRKALK